MASVQNLEVIVEIDISDAIRSLRRLQDKLEEVADDINQLDARGAEGIDVRTSVDDLDAELAMMAAQIMAFEAAHGEIDIGTSVDDGLDFNRPFMAPGSRAAARTGRIGAGMGMLFDSDEGRGGVMGRLADMASNATDSLGDLDIRMSDLHNIMATLIPLLFVFLGAIPAAATALITLAGAALAAAAAFVAIAGFGALGAAMGPGGGMPSAEDFQEFWTDIRDSFFEAFAPLAQRLAPLFEDALDDLEVFFQAIASEGDALMALTEEARAFGRWATEFIPRLLRGLAGLVEAMGPVLGMLGEFLSQNIVNIIRAFVRHTLDALPAVMALGRSIMNTLPALVQMSIGFARVSSAVIELIGILWRVFTLFGILPEEAIGLTIASLLTLLTVVALANKIFAVFSGTVVASAISSMLNFVAVNILGAESFAALGLSASIATAALIAFITVATLGAGIALAGAAMTAASEWLGFAGAIDAATGSMKDFNRVAGRGGTGNIQPYGGGGRPSPSGGMGGGGGSVTVNMERTGDKAKDDSDGNKLSWRLGRTTGKRP